MELLTQRELNQVSGGDAGPFGALIGGLIGTGVGTIVGVADAVSDYSETLDE